MIRDIDWMLGIRLAILTAVYCLAVEWWGEDRSLTFVVIFSGVYATLFGHIITEAYRIRLVKRKEFVMRLVMEGKIMTTNEVREYFKNR